MPATKDLAFVSASSASLKDLAPAVFRQRLLVEGFFGGDMTEERVRACLLQLAEALDLRTYGEPVVFQPASGMGKDENAGFDAFVPLIDSGISAYFWVSASFFSILLYTCKGFDADAAIAQSRELLDVQGEIVSHSF
jgi:S-adenosylmethionine decarboxylase